MPARNTDRHYGYVTKTFHWLTALLIFSAFGLGIYGINAPKETEADIAALATVFSIHKTVGIAAFFVALARILWAVTNQKPGLMHPEARVQNWAAEVVHWTLYGSMVAVPLSGWIHHAATTGFAPILWPLGQGLPLVPKSPEVAYLFKVLHWIFAMLLLGSLALHVAGALKHHVIDRDATLRRMLFGTATVTGLLAPHTRGPMVASFSLWIVVIAGGTALGWPDDQAAPTQELAAVESDWQVTDGTLGIAVTQFGSQVAGEFSDWTAEIAYDPDTGTGDVTVRINVGSLTLGSVTDNAKSADYLAAETFPFATFTGTIARQEGDAHTAQGTLTLRGQDAPVTLDFDLVVEGDGATMAGSATIDRRDHNVGDVQPTESNLGFSVGVTVTLTATRGELGV